MHRGKQAIITYLEKHGYEATYLGTNKICVAGKIICTMRDAIEFLLARNAFKKRKVWK